MSQPKTPPISIRLSPFLVARLEEWASSRAVTRNAAIAQFIEAGVAEPAKTPAEDAAPPKLRGRPAPRREGLPTLVEPAAGRVALPLGPQKFVSRLKNR